MAIKHIWFDCDGTLYPSPKELDDRVEKEILDELKIRKKLSLEQLRCDYKSALKKEGSKTRALGLFGISQEEAINIINRVKHADYVQTDPKLAVTLYDLKQQHLYLSIFTNNKRPILTEVLQKLELKDDLFYYQLTGSEVRSKPDEEGYQRIVARCKTELDQNPDELLFVGDRETTDLDPARNYGMNTLLVCSPESARFVDDFRRTYHFKKRTIYEIADVIAELNGPAQQPNRDQ